ncbi:hypothetical protein [Salinivibrio kushneri]|uniref:hypothetical protein n=1 Tax=Salinivibrio kushneri TaxID=1908198 RepID=UPI0009896710|nr:hypothetical protein [Salinivibrio kushneri]OOE63660.1 hypothetical protein BZG19_16065 [Salinivibrio kushneri]
MSNQEKPKWSHKTGKSELIPTRYPFALAAAMRKYTKRKKMTNADFIKRAVTEKLEREGVVINKN